MNHQNTNKRPRPESPRAAHPSSPPQSTPPDSTAGTHPHHSASSSFRNVSACNRCRLRKNRCDQNLPACSSCEKANVKCVGFDPITKREIPRAYVYYLESRVSYLEDILNSKHIPFSAADDFDAGTSRPSLESSLNSTGSTSPTVDRHAPLHSIHSVGEGEGRRKEEDKLNKLVSNIHMDSGPYQHRGSIQNTGVSFARVVFAAVRSSVSGSTSERAGLRPGKPSFSSIASGSGSLRRDSFFGLHSRSTYKQAPFPDRDLGLRLVNLYFEYANPQIPTLHRGEFMSMFERVYAIDERRRSHRELYMLNIVFAIGAGTIFGAPNSTPTPPSREDGFVKPDPDSPQLKRLRLMSQQAQAEEYHASAMSHLEFFMTSGPAADRPEGFGGSLEELQAVLLLAGLALLRPVAPGLWYIVGVAMRLAVDLGLHYEDGTGIEDSMAGTGVARSQEVALEGAGVRSTAIDAKEKGRREWVRDLRRRLWWCVYTFDRLVSTCVGRPFGITDQVITTEFPSILDDKYITTSGFTAHPGAEREPSYKRVAYHYFRLRLLQSEILQVLQYRHARQARQRGRNQQNEFMHTKLASPFLGRFDNFLSWRRDIDKRLWEWKQSAPHTEDTSVAFNVQFLELNYWQAVIMLYRQSLSVPQERGADESPITGPIEAPTEEENEEVFLKVAEAGQKVMKLYYQLNKAHLVNYTFLATHHLFMAGIGFLYAIWHSTAVRSHLTLDDVDYTVLAATTVLNNLMEKCPPAESCRDAFDRMAKATIQMCMSTTGFGTRAPMLGAPKPKRSDSYNSLQSPVEQSPTSLMMPETTSPQTQQTSYPHSRATSGAFGRPTRPPPRFDDNLRDLFPDDTPERQNFRNVAWQTTIPQQIAPPQQNLVFQRPNSHASASPISQFDPALRLQQQLTTSPSTNSQLYNTSFPSSNAPVNNPVSTFSNPQQPVSFEQFGFRSDLDDLLADTTTAYTGQPGLSLGFDSEHDWNDGWQPDMFDGFWFRGWSNGGGSGMPGDNGEGDEDMGG